MRDAGLSIKAWMDINDNDYNAVKDVLVAYLGWVGKVQQKNDPNGIDVRIEPKFTIPDGEPYTGETLHHATFLLLTIPRWLVSPPDRWTRPTSHGSVKVGFHPGQ